VPTTTEEIGFPIYTSIIILFEFALVVSLRKNKKK